MDSFENGSDDQVLPRFDSGKSYRNETILDELTYFCVLADKPLVRSMSEIYMPYSDIICKTNHVISARMAFLLFSPKWRNIRSRDRDFSIYESGPAQCIHLHTFHPYAAFRDGKKYSAFGTATLDSEGDRGLENAQVEIYSGVGEREHFENGGDSQFHIFAEVRGGEVWRWIHIVQKCGFTRLTLKM